MPKILLNNNTRRLGNRILEVIPGILAWTTITLPFWGGIFLPELTAYIVITFNVFWFYKSLSSVILFIIGYLRIREGENNDWMLKLRQIKYIDKSLKELADKKALLINSSNTAAAQIIKNNSRNQNTKKFFILSKLPYSILKIYASLEKRKAIKYIQKEITRFKNLKNKNILNWENLRHIVIIPFVMEPYEVLQPIMDRLSNQTFPTKKINIILATEVAKPEGYIVAQKLKANYGKFFENIWITQHKLAAGEIQGKSSNMAFAARFAQQKIHGLRWDKNMITLTSCDCDSQFDLQYFAYFTFLFITEQERYYKFFHAPMVYYANIWQVPFFGRVANSLFTINNIGKSVREDKNIQVSTYSASYKLIEEMGFWSSDIVPEDFHMFLKALFLHGDKVSIKPIYLKTLSDAAESTTFFKTAQNQYKQVKRWAWGVSDDVWMVKSWVRTKNKSVYTLYRVFHIMFDNYLWSTNSFILLLGANIPPLVNKKFALTVIGQKLPQISSTILTFTSIIFFMTVIVDILIKPQRPKKVSILRQILEQTQWLTLPLIGLVFGAIPGLDAQTRLLLGKHMVHHSTEKH